MSELQKQNQRLYERVFSAESALKNAREVLTMHIQRGAILDKIDAHNEKYLTPKDEFFNPVMDFIQWYHANQAATDSFIVDGFKKIFAKILNPNANAIKALKEVAAAFDCEDERHRMDAVPRGELLDKIKIIQYKYAEAVS